jgi:thiosulfate dehydrogenase
MKRTSWRHVIAVAAVFGAAGAGLGTGYVLWGWPTNWYAGHDLANLPPGPQSDLIRFGFELIANTPRHIGKSASDPAKRYAGNDLACTDCHLQSGLKPYAAPLVSTFSSFPAISADRFFTLAERINGCMTRSMNGAPLPEGSREMEGLIAYIRFVGTGSPQDVRVAGMGLKALRPAAQTPDRARGQAVYASNCAKCHGANGQGDLREPPAVGYAIPPLWGDTSFNAAAGMSELEIAAAFVHANMPPGSDYRTPTLTEQQAWDVAAFITTQPRPPGPRDAAKR